MSNIEKALVHISHSRMALWESSRKLFNDKYIEGKETPMFPQFIKGKRVDEVFKGVIEEDELTLEELLILKDMTADKRMVSAERKLDCSFKHKGEEYKIVGEIDMFNFHTNEISEVKTVKNDKFAISQTLKKARQQVGLYYFALEKMGEAVSRDTEIILIKKENGEITGEQEVVPFEVSKAQVKKVINRITLFINEVHEHYNTKE